jgi:cyclopropane-fatty-acyl-phospholipid synthase
MDGEWEPENGDLRHVLEVCVRMLSSAEISDRLDRILRRVQGLLLQINSPRSSRRNVHHHYEIDQQLYESFLDPGLFYSCAYFDRPDLDLTQAQRAKCQHIARKLDLRPNARVLDIGCGWGGLAMYLAEEHGAHVTGITLAQDQADVALQRVRERGLSDRVEIRVEDYRKTHGTFDGIVSVGMFEHVGRPQYPVFFNQIKRMLAQDGVALLHSIGRLAPPGSTNAWIRKYIFPGGYSPAASEVLTALEPTGLILADFEVLRVHYSKTLTHWYKRFQAARPRMVERMGERFCRMWEFYLLASEVSFLWGQLAVFHLQMVHQLDRLPITRDYLYREREGVRAVRPAVPELAEPVAARRIASRGH